MWGGGVPVPERDPTCPDTDAFGQPKLYARRFGFDAGPAQLFVSPVGGDGWQDVGTVTGLTMEIHPTSDDIELGRAIQEYIGYQCTHRFSGLLRTESWPMAPLRAQQRYPWHDWYDRVTRPAVTVRWKTWYAGIRWRYDAWSGLYVDEHTIYRRAAPVDRYMSSYRMADDIFGDPAEHERAALWRRLFAAAPPELDNEPFVDVAASRYDHPARGGSLSTDQIDDYLLAMVKGVQGAAERLQREEEWFIQERNRRLDRWYPGWRDAFEMAAQLTAGQEVDTGADDAEQVGRGAQQPGSDAQPEAVALPVRDPQDVRPQVGRSGGGGAGAEDGLSQPAGEEGCA